MSLSFFKAKVQRGHFNSIQSAKNRAPESAEQPPQWHISNSAQGKAPVAAQQDGEDLPCTKGMHEQR